MYVGMTASATIVTHGVPQGMVVRRLLFIISVKKTQFCLHVRRWMNDQTFRSAQITSKIVILWFLRG